MKVQAIVLPHYGIGDFLTHLPFVNALLKQFPKNQFIIFTKSRTKAKSLLRDQKNVKIYYIRDKSNFFSSSFDFFSLRNFFLKENIIKIWIFHRSPRFAIISFFSKVREILGFGYGIQKQFLNSGKCLNKNFKNSFPVVKGYEFLKTNSINLNPLNPFLKVSEKEIINIKKNFNLLPKPWILIGFSSTDQSRTWKSDYFIKLIEILNKHRKYSFFFIGAPSEYGDANKIIKSIKIKNSKIKNFCQPIEKTMALMDQSTFYIGNDAGNAHLALACRLKTYIIHGGSPPYSHTVYKNYYPREFLNNLKPILPPDGVIRNPMLRTIDTVSQEKGMDLIKPKDVVKKILKK